MRVTTVVLVFHTMPTPGVHHLLSGKALSPSLCHLQAHALWSRVLSPGHTFVSQQLVKHADAQPRHPTPGPWSLQVGPVIGMGWGSAPR